MSAVGDQTDWLAGAGGFEPLHLEIRSAELHPASTGSRRRSGAPFNSRCASSSPAPGLRVLANSDSNMQRFESRRPSQPVRLNASNMKVAREVRRYELVSVCGI